MLTILTMFTLKRKFQDAVLVEDVGSRIRLRVIIVRIVSIVRVGTRETAWELPGIRGPARRRRSRQEEAPRLGGSAVLTRRAAWQKALPAARVGGAPPACDCS